MLAIAGGDDLINAVIWLVGMGLIFWLLWWLIDFCAIPQPFNKVARIILALIAVILLIRLIIRVTGVSP